LESLIGFLVFRNFIQDVFGVDYGITLGLGIQGQKTHQQEKHPKFFHILYFKVMEYGLVALRMMV
jgi:hypothetical protein